MTLGIGALFLLLLTQFSWCNVMEVCVCTSEFQEPKGCLQARVYVALSQLAGMSLAKQCWTLPSTAQLPLSVHSHGFRPHHN